MEGLYPIIRRKRKALMPDEGGRKNVEGGMQNEHQSLTASAAGTPLVKVDEALAKAGRVKGGSR